MNMIVRSIFRKFIDEKVPFVIEYHGSKLRLSIDLSGGGVVNVDPTEMDFEKGLRRLYEIAEKIYPKLSEVECERCHEIFKRKDLRNFSYLCHIDEIVDGKGSSYVMTLENARGEKIGNNMSIGTSGREITVKICQRCYNEIMVPAIKVLKGIQ